MNPLAHCDYRPPVETPFAFLRLVASDKGLRALLWPVDLDANARVRLPDSSEDENHPQLIKARAQLDDYFLGRRETFDLELDPVGTEFQCLVWQSLSEISFGCTRSYGEQAARLDRASAIRAVASANGRNPLSIVVPCHRVLGANGSLTGFAGGLEAKAWLLEHEGAMLRLC